VVGVPAKELLMLTVEYLPGGASLPHRHDAQVFVAGKTAPAKIRVFIVKNKGAPVSRDVPSKAAP
jgi:hypothetical protein